MLWPTLISIAAVIVVGVPFTYYWFRWSDRWADAEKRRFHPKGDGSADQSVRVIRSDFSDVPDTSGASDAGDAGDC